MFNFYEVGGCVRDEIMGLKSKDIDYIAVADDELLYKTTSLEEIFYVLENFLSKEGYTIWLSTPDCFTIRAKFPADHKNAGITADFVLARKEVGYIPGTRRPQVVAGTLFDDLERRDFTVNAIAKDKDGNLIDPFNDIADIQSKVLRTPLSCEMTFNDDPLRMLRALRFHITKGFKFSLSITNTINGYPYPGGMDVVSTERIREEIHKCFKHNTLETLNVFEKFKPLRDYIFTKTNLWLKPTNEQ